MSQFCKPFARCYFFMALYHAWRSLIIGEPSHREASIAWTAALIQRWRGRPFVALGYANEAIRLYEQFQFGIPEERARMNIVFAEVALDAAIQCHPNSDDVDGTTAAHLLTEAERSLTSAVTMLTHHDDQLGLARARLVVARHSRLVGSDMDRFGVYESVEKMSLNAEDRLLLCQVWTERGDDLHAQGQEDAALACYRKALQAIAPSDASAMGMWARRAMLRASHP